MEERDANRIIARPPPPLPRVPLFVWVVVALLLVLYCLARFAG
jgi:hypothetical protein